MGLFLNPKKLVFYSFLLFAKNTYANELSIKVYGYPEQDVKSNSIDSFNPLQPETLGITTPGLVMPKLGSLGQKTSLRYNAYTSGDLVFLLDGFEITDPSDPSEGFDLSSFLMVPQFDFKLTGSDSGGLFSRQVGGALSVNMDPSSPSYIHSAFGSFGQSLLSFQKNRCSLKECFSLGLGGTFAEGQSASLNSDLAGGELENDQAALGFLSLTWRKQIKADRLFKLRFHARLSRTDIDDYTSDFIFRDDPNARLENKNYFLGLSYLIRDQEFFIENTLIERDLINDEDLKNPISKEENYAVFRSKLRGAHSLYKHKNRFLKDLDLYWYGQNINLNTSQLSINALSPARDINNQRQLSRFEAGVQLDQKTKWNSAIGLTSLSASALEGFDSSFGVSQNLEYTRPADNGFQGKTKLNLGFKQRRPSVFQLFDPEFGNVNLANEVLFFVRPELKAKFNSSAETEHNISMQYFFENIDSRVIFRSNANTNLSYTNTGQFNSNSLILNYNFKSLIFGSHIFFRQSLDPERVLLELPWLARQEIGFGSKSTFQMLSQIFELSFDIKWLLGMYNPSGEQVGNLVQSQGRLSYHIDTADRINLQLNNLFNDKKIWDEGFQRQPFSWMLSLTKTI